jgi:hypothetical protein
MEPVANIVIDMEGGCIQGISSDRPVNILILDSDETSEGFKPTWGLEHGIEPERIKKLLADPCCEMESKVYEIVVATHNKDDFDLYNQLVEITGKQAIEVVRNGKGRDFTFEFDDHRKAQDALMKLSEANLPVVIIADLERNK